MKPGHATRYRDLPGNHRETRRTTVPEKWWRLLVPHAGLFFNDLRTLCDNELIAGYIRYRVGHLSGNRFFSIFHVTMSGCIRRNTVWMEGSV